MTLSRLSYFSRESRWTSAETGEAEEISQSESFLRSCLSLSAPVNRRTYFLAGFSLAAVKYLGLVALIWQATGQFWKPTDYLPLTHSFFYTSLKGAPSWLLPAPGLCVLPFLLIWRHSHSATRVGSWDLSLVGSHLLRPLFQLRSHGGVLHSPEQ